MSNGVCAESERAVACIVTCIATDGGIAASPFGGKSGADGIRGANGKASGATGTMETTDALHCDCLLPVGSAIPAGGGLVLGPSTVAVIAFPPMAITGE
jgi:hypothetical protein